jgi:hypothetical protein
MCPVIRTTVLPVLLVQRPRKNEPVEGQLRDAIVFLFLSFSQTPKQRGSFPRSFVMREIK